jgi:hypothetical protein
MNEVSGGAQSKGLYSEARRLPQESVATAPSRELRRIGPDMVSGPLVAVGHRRTWSPCSERGYPGGPDCRRWRCLGEQPARPHTRERRLDLGARLTRPPGRWHSPVAQIPARTGQLLPNLIDPRRNSRRRRPNAPVIESLIALCRVFADDQEAFRAIRSALRGVVVRPDTHGRRALAPGHKYIARLGR